MKTITVLEPSFKSLFLSLRVNGTELATATGFLVQSSKGPLLITNRHNVTGRDNVTGEPLSKKTAATPTEIAIWHNLKGQLGKWVKFIEPLLHNDKPLWHEHPKLGVHADIVALSLTQVDNIDFYPYDINLVPQIQLMPSDIVSVVGFPYGMSTGGRLAIWATGFVASERELDYPSFLIDCRTRQGQSGSPVIAHRNGGAIAMVGGGVAVSPGTMTDFIGVYSGRINKNSDIGIVWKASIVQELVASVES